MVFSWSFLTYQDLDLGLQIPELDLVSDLPSFVWELDLGFPNLGHGLDFDSLSLDQHFYLDCRM